GLNDGSGEVATPLHAQAPKNVGFEALLTTKQSLEHVGNLTNLYFMPLPAHPFILALTVLTIVVVLVTPFIRGPNRRMSAMAAVATLAVVILVGATLPGGPLCASTIARVASTGATVAVIP